MSKTKIICLSVDHIGLCLAGRSYVIEKNRLRETLDQLQKVISNDDLV